MSSPEPRTPIAVVGVSAIFPGSTERQGFWRDIVTGRDLITDVPDNYWLIDDYYDPDPSAPDRTYGKRGAFLGAGLLLRFNGVGLSARLSARLGGRARLEVIDRARHAPNLEHPEAFNRLVVPFLRAGRVRRPAAGSARPVAP